MRTPNPQPKIAEDLQIPQNLRDFLREVHELIEQEDELVTTPSDDLLQTEFVYGGLLEDEDEEGMFGFTYFAEGNHRAKWDFVLSADEIAAIASGEQDTLRFWRCQTPGCGRRFGLAEELCFDCDYVDDEQDRKRQVLEGLRSCANREEWVRQYLRHFPDAHPLLIIGDYNGESQVTQSWEPFSLNSMRELIETLRGR